MRFSSLIITTSSLISSSLATCPKGYGITDGSQQQIVPFGICTLNGNGGQTIECHNGNVRHITWEFIGDDGTCGGDSNVGSQDLSDFFSFFTCEAVDDCNWATIFEWTVQNAVLECDSPESDTSFGGSNSNDCEVSTCELPEYFDPFEGVEDGPRFYVSVSNVETLSYDQFLFGDSGDFLSIDLCEDQYPSTGSSLGKKQNVLSCTNGFGGNAIEINTYASSTCSDTYQGSSLMSDYTSYVVTQTSTDIPVAEDDGNGNTIYKCRRMIGCSDPTAFGIPTAAPTAAPTSNPTSAPTQSPTDNPTTLSPTAEPTASSITGVASSQNTTDSNTSHSTSINAINCAVIIAIIWSVLQV